MRVPGAAGASVWENWRGKSDNEFLGSFGKAIDDFIESSNNASAVMEEAVDDVAVQVLAEYRKVSEACIQGLAYMAASGIHVETVLRELDRPEESDPALRDLHSLVLANLREKNLIGLRAEDNLRTILGIK